MPLSGDFESVNAQFPPSGFWSTNGFPPTASVFPPGDFVESANSLPPVDVHVKNSLSEFEWENMFSPGKFDPTNVDDAEDFQLSREESDLRFGPSLTGEEVDRTIRDRIPGKTRQSTQWAMSVFRAWCQGESRSAICEEAERTASLVCDGSSPTRRFSLPAQYISGAGSWDPVPFAREQSS